MNQHQIIINFETCNGCKKCYKACFVNVFTWNKEIKRPVVSYSEDCATCNWCELICPEDSIQVIPCNPPTMPEPYPKSFYPKSYVSN